MYVWLLFFNTHDSYGKSVSTLDSIYTSFALAYHAKADKEVGLKYAEFCHVTRWEVKNEL